MYTAGGLGATSATTAVGDWRVMQGTAAPDSDGRSLIVSNASGNDYASFWDGSQWVGQPRHPVVVH